MKTFGDIGKFGIRYHLSPNPFNEVGIYGKSWGQFELWVEGKDICKYEINGSIFSYQWNLLNIAEYFCINLKYVIHEQTFPLPVSGNDALELVSNSHSYLNKLENIYDAFEIFQDWEFRHSWFSSRAGSYLPNVYFRLKDELVEVSWCNSNIYKKDSIQFLHSTGSVVIEKDSFISLINEFVNSLFDDLFIDFPNAPTLVELKNELSNSL
ncbi:hypothetical protein [Paenibacillus hamazuiensis]|uniref:hypothetical protein n=1 Tax=Paenibacillus hamazuiensis TaxID=2936508 RepID=UPI00200E5E2E|nr:hypothetical protein [Paenibacillus hamazuiensis]